MPTIVFVNVMFYKEYGQRKDSPLRGEKRTITELIFVSGMTLKDAIVSYVKNTEMALFPDSKIYVIKEGFDAQEISKLAYDKKVK